MEDVVLSYLPLIGLTTQLNSISQIQSVVICVNRNVISKELMNLLYHTLLISRSQLLDIVNTTNVGKV